MAFISLKKTGLDQAAGAQIFDLEGWEGSFQHQLQIDVSETPTAGTLAVHVRTPGAADYVLLDSAIDMSSTALIATFEAFADSIKIVPDSFDGGKTYDAYLMTSDKK